MDKALKNKIRSIDRALKRLRETGMIVRVFDSNGKSRYFITPKGQQNCDERRRKRI